MRTTSVIHQFLKPAPQHVLRKAKQSLVPTQRLMESLRMTIPIAVGLTALFASLLSPATRAEGVVVQWEQFYNGPGTDIPAAAALDRAGNVIVTGTSFDSHDTGGNSDIYTAKYAAGDGALLWERRYDGPDSRNDRANGLVVDSAGNVIVIGLSFTASGWIDGHVAKYAAANGVLLWEKTYDGPAHRAEEFHGVALDSQDNVIVTGRTSTHVSRRGSWGTDFYTAKYAAGNGALLWEQIFSPARDNPVNDEVSQRVTVDSGDNVMIVGYTNSGDGPFMVVKYAASNGALLWSAELDTAVLGMTLDSADNVIVVRGIRGTSNIYTAKYAAASGALLWEQRYDPPGLKLGPDVKMDGDGDVIVTVVESDGSLFPTSLTLNTLKYAGTDGSQRSAHHFAIPGSPWATGRPAGMRLDENGNVFVTGVFASSESSNYDIYTAKYASGSGTLLWEIAYNGPDNRGDWGDFLLLDGSRSVIVVGRTNTETHENGSDYYIVKYTPVDLDVDNDGLLDSWEVVHFGSTDARNALDDTDGDGAVELLEMAFGTDPLSPGSVPAAASVIEGDYLTTTITKQPCVRYVVETGAGLESSFSAASTTVLRDTATTLEVRDNIPVGAQPARFLRVRVTPAP